MLGWPKKHQSQGYSPSVPCIETTYSIGSGEVIDYKTLCAEALKA